MSFISYAFIINNNNWHLQAEKASQVIEMRNQTVQLLWNISKKMPRMPNIPTLLRQIRHTAECQMSLIILHMHIFLSPVLNIAYDF